MPVFSFNPLSDLRSRLRRAAHGADAGRAVRMVAEPSERLQRRLEEIDGIGALEAFRVRFSQTGSPTKGGVRFDPGATLEESERLALLMSLKCALTGLPFGGAKGGVSVDASQLSSEQRLNIARCYAHAFKDIFEPHSDVPAPDIATGPEEMAVMAEALGARRGEIEAPVTGLLEDAGGLALREGATGRGAWRVYQRLCRAGACGPRPRIALQGFGKAGRSFAQAADADGARLVAVSDSRSAAHDPGALDLRQIMARKDDEGRVGADDDPESILTADADILVLAAKSDVVTAARAFTIKAPVIIELANAPVTGRGYRVLEARGRWTAPDLLVNAGGVVASFLEWREHASHQPADGPSLESQWDGILDRATDAVIEHSRSTGAPIHLAALQVALAQIDPSRRPRALPGL